MSKKLTLSIAAILSLSLLAPVFAETSAIYNGPTQFLNTTMDQNVEVNGPLKAKNFTLQGVLKINGPIEGDNLKIEELNATGPVTLSNSSVERSNITGELKANALKVEDYVNIVGGVDISNSSIEKLTAKAKKITINDSKVSQLIVPATNSGQQTVVLEGDTVIADEIAFESGNGVVVVRGNKVKHEGAKGGKIEAQKK